MNNLLRTPIRVSRARSLLAYQPDMSRRSLGGFLRSGLLATVLQGFWNTSVRKYGQVAILTAGIMLVSTVNTHAAETLTDPTRPPAESQEPGSPMSQTGPVLQSVKISPAGRTAIISGQEVKVGSRYGDEKVVKISEGEVLLRGSEGIQTLKLFPDVDKRNVPALEKNASGTTHPKKKRKVSDGNQ